MIMKKHWIIAATLALVVMAQAQPLPGPPPGFPGGPPPAAGVAATDAANYLIRVEWTDPKGESKFLELLTAAGNFELNTIQKTSVKINNNDVPTTLKLSGSIKPLEGDRGRLQLFLGRTVPYITGTTGGPAPVSSYSQMNVGLESNFIVKFDKPQTIQSDENGQITVLVKRLTD